jgi:hypothetical protein
MPRWLRIHFVPDWRNLKPIWVEFANFLVKLVPQNN